MSQLLTIHYNSEFLKSLELLVYLKLILVFLLFGLENNRKSLPLGIAFMSKHFLLCCVLWCNSGTIDSLILLHLPSFLKIYVWKIYFYFTQCITFFCNSHF